MKTALMILALSLTGLHAHAALPTGVSLMNREAANLVKATPRTMTASPLSCANFSGEWTGACQEGDESKPVNVKVAQEGCDKIEIDGKSVRLGANEAFTSSDPLFFLSSSSNSRLSKDGQALASYTAGVMDSGLFDEPFFFNATVRMTLSGENTLKVDGKMQVRQAAELRKELPFSCELTKSR